MAAVAKGSQRLLKVCPEHIFLPYMSSTLSLISVNARKQNNYIKYTHEVHMNCLKTLQNPNIQNTKYIMVTGWTQTCMFPAQVGGNTNRALTMENLQKLLALSAQAHMPPISIHPRITTVSWHSIQFASYCLIENQTRRTWFLSPCYQSFDKSHSDELGLAGGQGITASSVLLH